MSNPITASYEAKFWSYIIKTKGCWLWTGSKNLSGYGKVYIAKRTYLVHRIVWRIFYGNIPDGLCVLHKCDVRSCVNPEHLFIGTITDNYNDMLRKRRSAWSAGGIRKTLSDFNESHVTEIRRRYIYRTNGPALCGEFGISKSTLSRIILRQTWKHC